MVRNAFKLDEIFASRTDRSDGCWTWTGAVGSWGYASVSFRGRARSAHRVAYEHYKGPIPDGLTIDHLCRNRACVNPDHLEAVTIAENLRRRELPVMVACRKGHPRNEKNTRMRGTKHVCRVCEADASRRYQARKKGQS